MAGTSAADRHRLQELLAPVVAGAGYDLDAVDLSSVGRRVLVRLTVDGEHGIDLDAVADVTRQVSAALDEADPLDAPFVLEVSSPGVDRPLTEPRHWRRATGRLVATSRAGRPLTGRVLGLDADDTVRLDVDGVEQRIALAELAPGRVQVEFNRKNDETDGEGE